MPDFNENVENIENTLEQQQENFTDMANIDTGFDFKPIAIGVVAGTVTIALAKPATKLAVTGAKWFWSKTGAKLFAKKEAAPVEELEEEVEDTAEEPADTESKE